METDLSVPIGQDEQEAPPMPPKKASGRSPLRHGLRWNDEETQEAIRLVGEGRNMAYIARKLGRSVFAVRTRLQVRRELRDQARGQTVWQSERPPMLNDPSPSLQGDQIEKLLALAQLAASSGLNVRLVEDGILIKAGQTPPTRTVAPSASSA